MDILLYRQVRSQIVEICDYIYKQKWNEVCTQWKELEQKLIGIIPMEEKIFETLRECRVCVSKGNYLHLYDLLAYEIDLFIMQKLLYLSEEERKSFAQKAKKENEEVLGRRHKDILKLLYYDYQFSNVECSYIGTENISISVKEGDKKFQLFSNINPWAESVGIVNAREWKTDLPNEIYVLGFGGGHVINELRRQYPKTQIIVYIPNAEIFQVVMCNIPMKDVLEDENVILYYNPLCVEFFEILQKNRVSMFYINRQELRASCKNVMITKILLKKYKDNLVMDYMACEGDQLRKYRDADIGKRIHQYIKVNGVSD